MRSPAARFILGAVALLTLAAAGYVVHQIEQEVTSARAAERAFDLSVREAAGSLGDLRVDQLGYVAAGHDSEALAPLVKETAEDVTEAIAGLRSEASSEAARMALERAGELMADFGRVDQRARDYLKSGEQLMASDVISTEGVQGAGDAAHQLDLARAAELKAVEDAEAGLRQRQARVLAGAGGLAGVIVVLFVFTGPRQKAEGSAEAESLSIARAASPEPAAVSTSPVGVELREAPPASAYVTARPAGPVLRAASKLCTDLGRVSDLDELKLLISQAAEIMDATGVVVWIAAADGSYLQPAVSHGYAPQVMARMPRIQRSAGNAAAAAYRTGQMQIVLAHPGESNGAVVAPLLSVDGCIGALSAEIRGGGESSESVQALAAIFAAQLAGVLSASTASTAAQEEPRATATGTI